jgi:lysophospholipase L1-like esterase
MNKPLFSFIWLLLAPLLCLSQHKVIAVIGSSTAYGLGASPIDSSWVNLTKKYFLGLGQIDTVYNFGNPGTTSFTGMPTGNVPPDPYNIGAYQPDPLRNVTKALSLNPDVVIINFPTNDIGQDIPLSLFLSNLRTMYNTVVAAGRQCYITTTQPRDGFNTTEKQNLINGRDSILAEFGSFSLDFFDPIVDPSPVAPIANINPIYNADGTHPNNAGHQLLFQQVKANVVLTSPLALTLTSFNAIEQKNNKVLLNWTLYNDDATTPSFEMERSPDGISFTTVYSAQSRPGPGSADYSWTDASPLAGDNYYRLRIANGAGNFAYSRTVLVNSKQKQSLISWLGMTGNNNLQVRIRSAEAFRLSVFTAGGALVLQRAAPAAPAATTVPVPLENMARGVYILQIRTAGGAMETRSFSRL